jgi:hypothetical protein
VPRWQLVERFYNGLSERHRQTIDAACAGTFMTRTEDEAWALFETLSDNSIHLSSTYQERKPSIL